jgi:L-seryl-tRNA(Ser) seleniumtransferase
VPGSCAEPLRVGARPVVARVEGDRTLLDLRSLLPEDDDALATAVAEVAGRWS